MIDKTHRTGRYAVVGNPVAHSLSPQIHQLFAAQTGEKIEYGRILVAQSSFASFTKSLQLFFDEGGSGLNITLPFKELAAQWVTETSPEAQIAGAVNTITWSPREKPDGTIDPAQPSLLKGHNTDGSGLLHDLEHNIALNLVGMKTLILGAGGASRGIVAPILQAGANVVLANRTVARARALAQDISFQLPTRASSITVLPLEDCGATYDLVINATSAGVAGESLHIPNVCRGAFCYDLSYQRDGKTKFCEYARLQGAQETSDGLGMLVEQAAEAFLIWRGLRPDSAAVIQKLRIPGSTK